MEVRVLGELEVVGPGGVAIDVAGSRLRRLVTRLAVDAGHVVPNAELVDAVWGDDPPADPVGALQTLVSRLRRALGNPAVVQQSHQGYRLTVAGEAVDAQRFRRLARQGRDQLTAGDAATARTTLADALGMWRGPALADAEDGEYAVALAARLHVERLDALAARVDADLALGRAADVVAELEDLTRANPLREQLTGQLMRALAATGRAAEALAVYERLRTTLAETLGTDPSPALRELHVALLREDVPGVRPSMGRRPGLRAGLTSFLGREAETGPGARRARRQPAGHGGRPGWRGQDPAGHRGRRGRGRPPTAAAPRSSSWRRFATRAVSCPRSSPPSSCARPSSSSEPARRAAAPTTSRSWSRRCSAGPYLLVLDNCEHLLDAAAGSSRTCWRLPRRCGCWPPAANRWASTGSRCAPCRPLGLPQPWDVGLDAAMSYAAVQLFVDRASAVRSGLRRSTRRRWRRWSRSAAGWTGCRWPSSWPRRGCGCCPWPRSRNGWPTGSGC